MGVESVVEGVAWDLSSEQLQVTTQMKELHPTDPARVCF